jgi:hypothetical protein
MENQTVTIRIQCDPASGLQLIAYCQDPDGLTVEYVEIPSDGNVNLAWAQAVK